jgi:16S rRNA (uracil1498-N3)-methyltransferase
VSAAGAPRFFVEPTDMAGERFPLPDGIAHQVMNVLRLRDGDPLILLDGRGALARCHLERGDCVVESRGDAGAEPVHRLVVWQALLRGDHLEPVIRHGTELGVAEFRLLVTERCVARDLSPARLTRLHTIAREAAEQSERGFVPAVAPPAALDAALAATPAPSVLLYEREVGSRLSAQPPPAAVFIGPEGGFSSAEVAAARQAGVSVAGLGPRILRSETVAVAAAATILARTGDFA